MDRSAQQCPCAWPVVEEDCTRAGGRATSNVYTAALSLQNNSLETPANGGSADT
jgi:hypothetical protein